MRSQSVKEEEDNCLKDDGPGALLRSSIGVHGSLSAVCLLACLHGTASGRKHRREITTGDIGGGGGGGSDNNTGGTVDPVADGQRRLYPLRVAFNVSMIGVKRRSSLPNEVCLGLRRHGVLEIDQRAQCNKRATGTSTAAAAVHGRTAIERRHFPLRSTGDFVSP